MTRRDAMLNAVDSIGSIFMANHFGGLPAVELVGADLGVAWRRCMPHALRAFVQRIDRSHMTLVECWLLACEVGLYVDDSGALWGDLHGDLLDQPAAPWTLQNWARLIGDEALLEHLIGLERGDALAWMIQAGATCWNAGEECIAVLDLGDGFEVWVSNLKPPFDADVDDFDAFLEGLF